MRWAVALCIVALAVKAEAQNSYPPVDTSALQAQIAAAQSAIPPVCVNPPAKDTLNGTAGSAAPCTPLSDNARPTAVQAGNTTLASNCSFTITFVRPFASSVPFVYAAVVDTTGSQMPCKIQTRTSQVETGVCAVAASTPLSIANVTTGITVNPFTGNCVAGTPVMFVGREPTQ